MLLPQQAIKGRLLFHLSELMSLHYLWKPRCGCCRAERSRWQDPHVRTPARRTSCAAVVESSPSMRWKVSVARNVICWRRLTELFPIALFVVFKLVVLGSVSSKPRDRLKNVCEMTYFVSSEIRNRKLRTHDACCRLYDGLYRILSLDRKASSDVR